MAACGGGGGSTTTNANDQGGQPLLTPSTATVYAGVPTTFVITGGRRPYTITSSEPTTLAVPQTVDGGSFQVVAANPGVVDLNLPVGALPVRTVTIELRDARGQSAPPIQVKVAQNFLTGYGFSLSSNCPGTPGAIPVACSGGETALTLRPITNGNLFGNRPVQFEILRGPIQFVFPDTGQPRNGPITTTTDHSGTATVIFRVNANVTGQLAVIRTTDVATGVYVDDVVPIVALGPTTTLTAIPNKFTFTGALSTQCGTGSADFLVFDGQPPYTALSSDPNVTVTPTSTNANPARFTLRASNPNVCLTDATIVITDSAGGRTTVTVTTATGSQQPPTPPPLAVAPTSLTLACGTSGNASVVGGSGSYFVNSSHPRISAIVSGNTITITRVTGDGTAVFPTTGSIAVSDGTVIQTISVSVPANCP